MLQVAEVPFSTSVLWYSFTLKMYGWHGSFSMKANLSSFKKESTVLEIPAGF